MPSGRARASFEPIPPDLDLKALVEETPHFQYVDRISCDLIDQQGYEEFDKLVLVHVVLGGKPLIIDGYDARLDEWTFSSKWLLDNHGQKVETARNITKQEPMPLTIAHYLRNMSRLTDQYFEKPDNYKEKDRQRIYLKDIDPPPVWTDKLREQLPPNLFYLNESIGDIGGPGADDEKLPGGGSRRSRGIAPAGDLMSSLPPSMRAENIMCYIGHEGTYTPAHREMCASLGHNIMVEDSNLLGDDGRPEKPGSSIWFMTETKDRQTVSEYWLSILGHDIEVEKHFAQIAAWKKAPFTVYVCEQRAGDLLLIPPLAPHQVWNRGTRTMKVAWNRTTVETLELAMQEALPKARMVCRDEQYKNKAIVYYSLHKYAGFLNKARDLMRTAPSPEEQNALRHSPKIRQLRKDFKRLFRIFKDILLSEMFARDTTERNVQFLPFDSNVTCAYCRSNIFNRFLSCPNCEMALGTEQPEPYDICMECYAMGRSCYCISKLRWTEQFKWKDLVAKYETWRRIYLEIDGNKVTDSTPLPIAEERQRYPKNTLAQICQYQLKRRPWTDIKKPPSESEGSESEDNQIQYAEDGTVKKRKKKRSEAWLKNNRPCHVCAHRHPRWKMAECPCGRCWCYGTLFRGHDVMPQEVMEDLAWKCPHCQGICSAGNCRKDPRQTPYEPKGTLLGHDTRAVADARSVESLVDFSVSNLVWLKESTSTPAENARLRKKQEEAARSKLHDPAINGHYYATEDDAADGPGNRSGIELEDASTLDPALSNQDEPSFIDPSLLGDEANDEEGRALPVAALLNRENNRDDDDDDDDANDDNEYMAARQSGFVAPSAVMYHDPSNNANDKSPDQGGKKRKLTPAEQAALAARLAAKAARRDTGPVSGATKQYRKDYEKRALEEARRKGRYIQVSAKLRGKTKLVRLRISPAKLRHFRDTMAAESNEIMASDVQPRDPAVPGAPGLGAGATAKAKDKAVVIRAERDDDFVTRKRDRKRKAAGAWDKDVEEIDVPSDPDDDEAVFGEPPMEGAIEMEGGRKRRRISQWQARRAAEGDAEEEVDDDGGGVEIRSKRHSKAHRNKPLPLRTENGKFVKKPKLKPSQPLTKKTVKSISGLRPNGGNAPKSISISSSPRRILTTKPKSNTPKQSKEASETARSLPRSSLGRNQIDRAAQSISSDSSSSPASSASNDDHETPVFASDVSATAMVASALKHADTAEEQNRRAKLAAGGLFEDSEFGESEDEGLFVKGVATSSSSFRPSATTTTSLKAKSPGGLGEGIADISKKLNAGTGGAGSKSIFAKKGGPGGRKIKIVGARREQT